MKPVGVKAHWEISNRVNCIAEEHDRKTGKSKCQVGIRQREAGASTKKCKLRDRVNQTRHGPKIESNVKAIGWLREGVASDFRNKDQRYKTQL